MNQLEIKVAELAYLLHILEASNIIGIDNTTIRPMDKEQSKELLESGFNALMAHGWIETEGRKHNTYPLLVLLVAVMVAPEKTILVTSHMPQSSIQSICYYFANNFIVEQFTTDQKRYFITQLGSRLDMVQRLEHALHLPSSAQTWQKLIKFEKDLIAFNVQQENFVGKLLKLINTGRINHIEFPSLTRLEHIATIQFSAFQGEQQHNAQYLFLLESEGAFWALSQDTHDNSLTLIPLSQANFASLIQAMY